ncbi:hypothetical protein [Allosphingosinicella indica]|uniref:hypothetical protein n=1 Tax=Allosphingosinicella indica TaxID=941907 RepID=UPI000A14C4B5|nr:hypothetical protein [Allosphingosinicella indica]
MLTLIALSAGIAATVQPSSAAEIFRAACLSDDKGLAPEGAVEIAQAELPPVLQTSLRFPILPEDPPMPVVMRQKVGNTFSQSSGKYYSIAGQRPAFVAVQEVARPAGVPHQICSVASKAIRFQDAVEHFSTTALSALRKEHPVLGSGRTLILRTPSASGHSITIERLQDGYVVFQSSIAKRVASPSAARERIC